LLVFYVAHEHVSGPFTQVAQMLGEPGFPNPADTIPWPRGSDFAGVFTRNINFHLPQSKDSEGVPMYKLTEKTGPTYQAPRARRGPKSTRLFQGEALRTGAQLGPNVLSDGIGSITLHNRTNTDGVVEVARASAPHLYLSIVYLQANGTLAISGFGTGIYAITASFGHQWDSRARKFLQQKSPSTTLGSFQFLQFESATGKHCNSYEILIRPIG